MLERIEREGFSVISSVISASAVTNLQHAVAPLLARAPSAGIRGLAGKVPSIRALADAEPIRVIVEQALGPQATLVRSVLFNKTDKINWQVAWHQDLSIAVRERVDAAGLGPWNMKDGVWHVQPPQAILERMLTVRVHLDDADESNGALRVVPGSHRLGRLPATEAATVAQRLGQRLCTVNAGDLLLFHPLLLHCSRKATCTRPRRIIHLEYCGAELPEPLAWAEAAQLCHTSGR